MIAAYFKFAERGTDLVTEIRAGATTFMVMAYIIFLNPAILGAAGVDPVATAAATALIAGIMTIAMGVFGNFPIAIAAGLGINAVVAFGLVLGRGLSFEGAMGVIFWEGLIVTLLVVLGLREAVMNAIPGSLKRAIAVGIGLFILFIGFVNAGLIAGGEGAPPVHFIFPVDNGPFVALAGLIITIVLWVRKIPGALILSIVITTAIALAVGVATVPTSFTSDATFSTIGKLSFTEVFEKLGIVVAVAVIFSIAIIDFFDTMGTVTAVGNQAGLTDDEGRVPGLRNILLVDSVAAIAGGFGGTSSNTSYIESSAGVGEGGRTGFTSVVTGVLFLVSIILAPLALMIPAVATAPALIIVGYLLFEQVGGIDVGDVEEGLPALLAMILMPLTYDIAVGIGAGFIAWTLIKLVRGKLGEIHPLMWVVTVMFVLFFLLPWLEPIIAG
ncbi:MAG: NCS2 family permease [Chloroflexota bacterium]